MLEPVTLTALIATPLGGLMWGMVGGLATNCVEPGRQAVWDTVSGWWKDGSTQQNHDVLKATHAAYVAAMGKMAAAATAIAFSDDEVMAATALTAKIAESVFKDFRWDGGHLPLDACQAQIETLFAGRHMPGTDDDGWRLFNQMVVDDLAAWGVPLPPRLTALFVAGEETYAPWHLVFRAEFAEELKADEKKPEGERAFRILTFERLNELTANGAVLTEGVAELHRLLIAVDRKVTQMMADIGLLSDDIRTLIDWLPDLALRREIVALVNSHPAASVTEIAGDVARFARNYRALEAQVAAIATTDNHVGSLKAAATAALERGNLAEAQRLFGEAKSVRRERAQREATEAAEFAKAEGDAAMLQRDWQAADAAWSEAEALLAPFDLAGAESQAWGAADALQSHGDRFASLAALAAAATRWRSLRGAAQRRNESERAAALNNNLGNTLQVQGERSGGEAGLELLDKAVAAYRAALEVYTRDAAPARWAATQNNLGNALSVQGKRSGGATGLALLADAVAAYRAALEVHTRDAAPADWATTQNNLGATLKVQGEHSGGAAGQALLADAVAAYRAALEVRTRDAAPDDWALTQNNLGNALRLKGKRGGGAEERTLLTAAVAAYRAALEVHTRDAAPAQWAMTQNNLGNTLQAQGERSGGAAGLALLDEAVAAYRAALELRTRNATPVQWAMTQGNVAMAELVRSQVSRGDEAPNFARAAREACVAALTVFSPEHMPYDNGKATALLLRIDARLAELSAG